VWRLKPTTFYLIDQDVMKFQPVEEAMIEDALEETRRHVLDSNFNKAGHSRIALQ
jgi:hypothetical protein